MSVWAREDIVWLAGYFEGEGSISLTQYEHRAHYILSITSCDKDTLERVRDIIGFGNFSGPYKRKNKDNKPYWQFQMSKKYQVLPILWAIYPWLGERRKAKVREVSLDFRKIRQDGRSKLLKHLSESLGYSIEEAKAFIEKRPN